MAYFQHGGYSDEQIARSAQITQDREETPVEYRKLNELRLTSKRFTRRWDQLVTPEEWYGPRNRPILDAVCFEHVLCCVQVLNDSGLFSGITLKRRACSKVNPFLMSRPALGWSLLRLRAGSVLPVACSL